MASVHLRVLLCALCAVYMAESQNHTEMSKIVPASMPASTSPIVSPSPSAASSISPSMNDSKSKTVSPSMIVSPSPSIASKSIHRSSSVKPSNRSSTRHPSTRVKSISPSRSHSRPPASSTVKPTGKPSPTTQPTHNAKVIAFKKNNKTCIKMKAVIKMDVKNHEVTYFVDEKSNITVNGTCGNTTRSLTIKMGKKFQLSLFFDIVSGVFAAMLGKSKKQWEQTSLQAKFFFGNQTVKVNDKKSRYRSDVDTYYSCNNGLQFSSGGVSFDFSKFEVQPFSEDTKNTTKGFGDKGEICKADEPTPTPTTGPDSDIVPIAVGCALAGLVVIVLIAYIIGRRRTHRGYQQV